MMNIFNIFDPATSNLLSTNWLFFLINNLLLPKSFWIITSRWSMSWFIIIKFLNSELEVNLKKKVYKISLSSIFLMFCLVNFLGLFPFVFTSSSHMNVNLSMALPMWMSFMIIGWTMNYKKMLIHQVPLGTPSILMAFMVMIEFISNIIRPGTLSIRLTANMIAGHLLLTLMSNNGNKLFFMLSIMLIFTQTILMVLEMSVSIIQAYVFTMLLSLYSQEMS